jgi:hypothetical protein
VGWSPPLSESSGRLRACSSPRPGRGGGLGGGGEPAWRGSRASRAIWLGLRLRGWVIAARAKVVVVLSKVWDTALRAMAPGTSPASAAGFTTPI